MLTTILNIVNSLCLGPLHISPLLPIMVSKHQYACNAFIFIKCHNLTSNSLQIYLYSHRLFSMITAEHCNSQKTDSATNIVVISQTMVSIFKKLNMNSRNINKYEIHYNTQFCLIRQA